MDMGRGIEGAFASQTRHYAKAREENIAFEDGKITMEQGPPSVGPDGQPVMGPDGQPIPQIVFRNADGSDVLLHDDDDHAIHLDVHAEIVLDVSKPWPIRQMLIEHCEDHRQAMQPPPGLLPQAAPGAAGAAPPKPPPGPPQ
jgi:hypothetical protein